MKRDGRAVIFGVFVVFAVVNWVAPAQAGRVSPVPGWTGFYVGVTGGAAWGDFATGLHLLQNNGSTTPSNAILESAGTTSYSPTAFAVGGQLGFNYQFMPQFVAGIEADLNYLGLSASRQTAPVVRAPDPSAEFTDEAEIRALSTLRARLGWLATPQLLIFATGGLAVANVRYSESIHFIQTPDTSYNRASVSRWRTGPVIGAGFEYALSSRASVKLEYLYSSLGKVSFDTVNEFDPTYRLRHELDVNASVLRVGLNVHL